MVEKLCKTCGERKPVAAFNRNRTKADGLQSQCRDCQRPLKRAWKRAHPEKAQASVKEWRERHPERVRALKQDWDRRHREAANAHKKVDWAIKTGKLARSTECEGCGVVRNDLEGHHDDYAKPLEVRWLCNVCHGLEHAPSRYAEAKPE